uniref:Outer capsid glycoprotein VP7 n=1 Tax=Rotavirus A TaxID=28875 RepID=A0A8D5ZCS3_9REOV|nr:outer capsid glycoprotein VP7 [Rotavirus A]
MYGIEYTAIALVFFKLIFITYCLRELSRMLDYIIYRFLFIACILAPFIKCQNYGINLPITGSMDITLANSSLQEEMLTSTLCLYYPTEAKTEINDATWTDTLSQLFLTKGFPSGSVYFKEYTDIESFSVNPQLYCDYNLVFMKYDANKQLDMSELADLILNEWLCNPMDIKLYYYQQTDETNKWISMGSSCTVKVCPLNSQTLGIGCLTTDTTTFEEVATAEKLAITDVVDKVDHKLDVTTSTCTIRNCKKLGPRENVAVIQVGGADVIDITADPTTAPQTARMMRVNWKKWWQVFYTVVDYVNQIIQLMSKRSRSMDSSSFYYRI